MMIAASAFSTTLENRNNLDLTPEGSSLEEYLVIRLSNVKFPSQMSILSCQIPFANVHIIITGKITGGQISVSILFNQWNDNHRSVGNDYDIHKKK